MTGTTATLAPVASTERLPALDVLRGFALLGILAMNIQSFSLPGAAYFFPTVHGDLGGVNHGLWYLSELLARRKFMGLFSMLFGAGVLLMDERARAAGRGWAGLHYRRMGVLWLIGMAHAYLLWSGDILVPYAACGLLLYLFRRLRASRLIVLGVLFLAVGSGLSLMAGLSAPHWPPESLAEFNAQWRPGPEAVAEEIAVMGRSGWAAEIAHRAPDTLMIQLFYFPFHILWRAGGYMLLGMALYKLGWLQGGAGRRSCWTWIVLGLLVGVPMTAWGVHRAEASGWDPATSFFVASQWGYWGSVPIALGYAGAISLLMRGRVLPGLLARLGAVGRTAFSNYLLHTLICTTLFMGHGLGLFGRVERIGQAGIVVAIWALQLAVAPVWLRHFRYGPAEWLWRSLSYRRRQPFRRPAAR